MFLIGITAACAIVKEGCIFRRVHRICDFERDLDNSKSLFTSNMYHIIKQPC